jgi:hypothetical protein
MPKMKVHPEMLMKTKGRQTGVRFQVPGVREGVARVLGHHGKFKIQDSRS